MVDLRITAKPSSIKSPQTTTDESNERSTIKLRKHWLRKGDHSTDSPPMTSRTASGTKLVDGLKRSTTVTSVYGLPHSRISCQCGRPTRLPSSKFHQCLSSDASGLGAGRNFENQRWFHGRAERGDRGGSEQAMIRLPLTKAQSAKLDAAKPVGECAFVMGYAQRHARPGHGKFSLVVTFTNCHGSPKTSHLGSLQNQPL